MTAAVRLTGDDDPVFLINDWVGAISILFVRTGRDSVFSVIRAGSDFWGSMVEEAVGGWFIGRLEIVFTTLGRSCPRMLPPNPAVSENTAAARIAVFLKIIKLVS